MDSCVQHVPFPYEEVFDSPEARPGLDGCSEGYAPLTPTPDRSSEPIDPLPIVLQHTGGGHPWPE